MTKYCCRFHANSIFTHAKSPCFFSSFLLHGHVVIDIPKSVVSDLNIHAIKVTSSLHYDISGSEMPTKMRNTSTLFRILEGKKNFFCYKYRGKRHFSRIIWNLPKWKSLTEQSFCLVNVSSLDLSFKPLLAV